MSYGRTKPEVTVGFALGGGGMRGAAHLGVLDVLEEAGVRADVIAGTSAGSIVGAGLASGLTTHEMMELLRSLSFRDVARPSVRSKYSLLDTTPLEGFIERSVGAISFDDLKMPFAAVAVDMVTAERVVITEGSVSRAVLASSAIPGVFPPVEHGDALLVDGGIIDLVPADVARDLGAEYVIAVDLIPRRRDPRRPANFQELLLASYEIMQHEAANKAHKADAIISPAISGLRLMDFSIVDETYERGREVALEQVDSIVDDLGL